MAPGGDFAGFIEQTGTGEFTHLDDETGELWTRFGAKGQSTFMFINDDGSFVQTGYGLIGEERLVDEVERLLGT
ncbi:MAG: hypothetical protein GY724_07070 [Actinomycetia bacterium]|nr:hypothetical protein [Actinomycetes bacterium]MCP5035098.1 hypothetical protein [Actinomycetes bacterium]